MSAEAGIANGQSLSALPSPSPSPAPCVRRTYVTFPRAPFILCCCGLYLCKLKIHPSSSDPGRLKARTEQPWLGPVTISHRDSLNFRSTLVPAASEAQDLEILRLRPHYHSNVTFAATSPGRISCCIHVAPTFCTQFWYFICHTTYLLLVTISSFILLWVPQVLRS